MYAPSLVSANGIGVSPPSVEFDVPADGSAEVEFTVYYFNGDVEISLEDIPLRVEPTLVPVTAEGTRVILTFYGDESLGSRVFRGKIRFLALTGEWYAYGVKIRATVNHIVAGKPAPWLSSWLPMSPKMGPPLPSWMDIFWPWV